MRRMTYFKLGLLAVVLSLLAVPAAGGAATAALDPATQKAIDAAVVRELAAYGGAKPVPGVVVGVWVPGKGEYTKGYGYADLATKSPMQLDDRFRLGSITKTFVATVLLQLVDEKKLRLDDTIGKFGLGFNIPKENQITLRQLAEMRSGIIDVYSVPGVQKQSAAFWSKQTTRQWVALAAKQPLLFAPGTKYNYSNTNWFLLGLIIEKVTHDSIQKPDFEAYTRPDVASGNVVSGDRLEHAVAVRARLHVGKRRVGRSVGILSAFGVVGGRCHDLRHGRYEALG
jgi:D-alanyl-D-alanine carboxypeptidase